MAEQEFKDKVKQMFKHHFPEYTVDVSDGYSDNVHVVIVSRKLDGLREKEKVAFLFDIAQRSLGDNATRISLLLGYSPAELK